MQMRTINGYYGSGKTPCRIFVADDLKRGSSWYCVEGSQNVNLYYTIQITQGVNVERLPDLDAFTSSATINSEEQLAFAVDA